VKSGVWLANRRFSGLHQRDNIHLFIFLCSQAIPQCTEQL
jgi:hypothetical protein